MDASEGFNFPFFSNTAATPMNRTIALDDPYILGMMLSGNPTASMEIRTTDASDQPASSFVFTDSTDLDLNAPLANTIEQPRFADDLSPQPAQQQQHGGLHISHRPAQTLSLATGMPPPILPARPIQCSPSAPASHGGASPASRPRPIDAPGGATRKARTVPKAKSKGPTPQEWERHKSEIQYLWNVKKVSLPEIIKIMEQKYGFIAR